MPKHFNQKINSALVARRLYVEALAPLVHNEGIDIAALITPEINTLIAGFFQDMVQYLGNDEDLESQLPGIPGLRPWNPLSLEWERRKQSSEFFIWSALRDHSNAAERKLLIKARKSMRTKVEKAVRARATTRINESLIANLSGINAIETLGGCKVVVRDRITREVITIKERTVQRPVTRYAGTPKEQNYNLSVVEKYPEETTPKMLGLTITIDIFTGIKQTEVAHVEDFLLGKGVLSQASYYKLQAANKGNSKRPLIVPFMIYYSQIRLPELIQDVISSNYKFVAGISIKGNKSVGPL